MTVCIFPFTENVGQSINIISAFSRIESPCKIVGETLSKRTLWPKYGNFGKRVTKFMNVKPDRPVGNHIDYPTLEPTTGRNSIFVLTVKYY